MTFAGHDVMVKVRVTGTVETTVVVDCPVPDDAGRGISAVNDDAEMAVMGVAGGIAELVPSDGTFGTSIVASSVSLEVGGRLSSGAV